MASSSQDMRVNTSSTYSYADLENFLCKFLGVQVQTAEEANEDGESKFRSHPMARQSIEDLSNSNSFHRIYPPIPYSPPQYDSAPITQES